MEQESKVYKAKEITPDCLTSLGETALNNEPESASELSSIIDAGLPKNWIEINQQRSSLGLEPLDNEARALWSRWASRSKNQHQR